MKRQQGFTFIVILIVMAVIGVMAARHMSSLFVEKEENTPENIMDQASVMRIMSDLGEMKTAAQAYFTDRGKWPETIDDLAPYTGRSGLSSGNFILTVRDRNIFILRELPRDRPELIQTLAIKAGDGGFSGCSSETELITFGPHPFSKEDSFLVIKVR